MSREDDRSLRFYNEVLGLDHLHYGIWEGDEELTLANMKVAQLRYEDLLVSKLPQQARKILDVGCGTSAMTKRMLDMGLDVHGLSPDETQKNNFTHNLNAPFYHSFFEAFESEEKFDCLIMSESAQYIPPTRLFENSRKHLVKHGHLMICDYFVLDNAKGVMAKSGHNLTEFRKESENHGFTLMEEKDITDEISKTLDLAQHLINRALMGLDIMSEKIRKKHPFFTRILFRIFKKKWAKLNQNKILINSKEFKRQKRYLFLLYRCEEVGA